MNMPHEFKRLRVIEMANEYLFMVILTLCLMLTDLVYNSVFGDDPHVDQ